MSVTMTITDVDLGMSALTKRLKVLGKTTIEAGLFDPVQAQKGHWLEVGFKHPTAGQIEPRAWASVAGDMSVQTIGSMMGVAIGAVCDGADPHDALDPVGEFLADRMAGVIYERNVGGPANTTATQDLKGHAVKGLDSGDMISALEWKVTP